MKIKKIVLLFYLMIALVAIQGCKEEEPEIGEPFSKIEGLTATDWIISEVFLVDESNPAKPERNISNFYTGGSNLLAVSFKSDYTFSVTPGDGLNFFPDAGTWSFDRNDAPREIILVSTDGVTTVAPLGGPTRISDQQLKINFVKRSCSEDGEEKAALGYRLIFNRK
ncbi:hypothetical protein G3O08_09620 [Cryomorpha ignava]|uniref:DUF5004 domain-containing protein n=1 Tax=Cryomorpha ignava TaxID=101383 RepID=A0A7K3WQJ5_9FLAO|nr:hypothetical protein [Cryomorpha ignava]NEN23758.1 hypothetical protein [Cryomorpha ignava]